MSEQDSKNKICNKSNKNIVCFGSFGSLPLLTLNRSNEFDKNTLFRILADTRNNSSKANETRSDRNSWFCRVNIFRPVTAKRFDCLLSFWLHSSDSLGVFRSLRLSESRENGKNRRAWRARKSETKDVSYPYNNFEYIRNKFWNTFNLSFAIGFS